MSNSNFPRRAVDEAIDRAVRDLMQIDPHPGLHRRVLSRIKRRSLGPWILGSRASTVLFPAAALIAIVVALILPRLREKPIEVTQSPAPLALPAPSAHLAPSALPAPSALSAPSAPSAPSSKGRSLRDVPTATFDSRRDGVTATNLRSPITDNEEPAGWMLDALHTIRALPTETAAPAPLALPALEIQPLQLQALAPRR